MEEDDETKIVCSNQVEVSIFPSSKSTYIKAPPKDSLTVVTETTENVPVEVKSIMKVIGLCKSIDDVKRICWWSFNKNRKHYRLQQRDTNIHCQCQCCGQYIVIKARGNPLNVTFLITSFGPNHNSTLFNRNDNYCHTSSIIEAEVLISKYCPTEQLEGLTETIMQTSDYTIYDKKKVQEIVKTKKSIISYLQNLELRNLNKVKTDIISYKENDKIIIKGVLVTFPICDRMTDCCKIIGIDTTFNRIYDYSITYATTIDQNRELLCLGLMISFEERKNAISFLLVNLKERIQMNDSSIVEELIFITDRGTAITSSINEIFPNCKHFYCIWHIAKNILGFIGDKYKINVMTLLGDITPLMNSIATCGTIEVINKQIHQIGQLINGIIKDVELEQIELDLIEYIFEKSCPTKWIGYFIENPMRYSYTTSQLCESFNHEVSEANYEKILEAIEIVTTDQRNVIERRQMNIEKQMGEDEFIGLVRMESEIEKMRINCEEMEEKYKISVTRKDNIQTKMTIYTLLLNCNRVKVIADNTRTSTVYRCECGIPQNNGYPCQHMMYLLKHNYIGDSTKPFLLKIKDFTHPSIDVESYLRIYDDMQIEIPDPDCTEINTNEYIPFDEEKIRNMRTRTNQTRDIVNEMMNDDFDFTEFNESFYSRNINALKAILIRQRENSIAKENNKQQLLNKQDQNEIETKKESLKRELLSSQSTKGVKRPNPKGEMTQITKKGCIKDKSNKCWNILLKLSSNQLYRMDRYFQLQYQYLHEINKDSGLGSQTVKLFISLFRFLLEKVKLKSIVVYEIVETENDILLNTKIQGRPNYLLIPQFIRREPVGHYILNVVNCKQAKATIMNSLVPFKPSFYASSKFVDEKDVTVLESINQQPSNSLQCGFRCLYNMFKTIESIHNTKTIGFQHDKAEFESFQSIVIKTHNQSIQLSKLKDPSYASKNTHK